MKKYELLTIVKPSIDLDEADKVIAKVGDIVTSLKGTILDTEKMGRKKLAYDVKGFRDGYMVNQKLNLPEDQVKELKRQLKLNENIIRTMFSQAK
jgi:small subunit ribosomal protein S6